jgi:hypothetical protein
MVCVQINLMLRYLVPSFLILLLTACSTTHTDASPSPRESSSGEAYASGERLDSVTQSLLAYAASDFRAHSPAVAQVRNVRVGHVLTAKGQKQYLVCGEFLPAHSEGQGEWTTFATIKTHPYEQWLGAQAESWCRNSKVNWEKNEGDLSSALRSRLDSLK